MTGVQTCALPISKKYTEFLDEYFEKVNYDDDGNSYPATHYACDRILLVIAGPVQDCFPIEIRAGFAIYDSKKREWIFKENLVDVNNNVSCFDDRITHYQDNCDAVSSVTQLFQDLYTLYESKEPEGTE